jgi:purine-binding chemotaxis protein CheW
MSNEVSDSAQYLTFLLDKEHFAIEIRRIREVLAYTAPTKVPRTPPFMVGVINLRGHVVPVIDLRLKLGLSAIKRTVDTCIIILEVALDGEKTVVGALADAVQEVVDIFASQVAPPPRMGTRIETTFIKGMARRDEQFVVLLDIDRLLSASDVAVAGGVSESGAVPGPRAVDSAAITPVSGA